MTATDLLVLSSIAVVLAFPLLKAAASKFLPRLPVVQAESKAAWQQRWTNTLIELLADLDKDANKPAATLCRELMWEILGGDQGTTKK